MPFRKQISLAAYHARRHLSRVDDAEIRKARVLARLARADKLDVVYFGDSTTSFRSLDDEDRRPLHRMIADMLPAGTRMHTVHGGSYSPPLYSGFLRLIESSGARPIVIFPLCVRVRTTPWMEHPIHGRKGAIDHLAAMDADMPTWRIRQGFPAPTAQEWAAFRALSHPTWAGDWKIGDYLDRLKNPAELTDEWVKLLYAYHHGGRVPSGRPLQEVTRFGSELRRLGLDVIAYETPIPVEKGEEYYPGFRSLAEENLASLGEAYRAGYGTEATVLRTGLVSGTDEFIDYRDASEHVNQRGRLRLAESITGTVGHRLKQPS